MTLNGRDFMRQRAQQFQEIRLRLLWLCLAPCALLMLLVLICRYFGVLLWVSEVLFIGVILTVAFVSWKYRCPGCKRIPTSGEGLNLNPKKCEHCGIMLKWED
jgi:hypothetical protein